MTKKELKRFKISESEDYFFCKSPDSLEHAFLECPAGLNIFQKVLAWFTNENRVNFTPSIIQLLFKSECRQESSKIRNMRQKCENPNLLKLGLLVVHIELFIDMWFISQIEFCFGGKWRFQISRPDVRKLGFKINNFEENRMSQG